MDKLTTTLLTGAAMTALTVAPGMAAVQHTPMVAMKTASGIITLKGTAHLKTNIHNPQHGPSTFTTTYTYYQYTYSFARSSLYKKTVDLPAFAFYTVSSGGHCVDFEPQKAKAVATGGNGKAKVYTVKSHVTIGTGTTACTGTLTFYGPAYKLTSASATFSSVQLNDKLTFKSHYTTTTTTTTTGVKHRQKHHKHKYKNKEFFTGREVVNLHIH